VYIRHVPPAHDGETPIPLVVDFHGYSEGAQIHAQHSALGPFGDQEEFVTVTPQGLGEIPRWDTGLAPPHLSPASETSTAVSRSDRSR